MFRTIFLISVSFLSACAATPEPYNGIKGYQLERSGNELSVIYTDEISRDRDHMLSLIADVCSAEGGQSASPGNLAVTSERITAKKIETPFRVPNTTTTARGAFGGHITTTFHDQIAFNTMKFRQITVKCSDV